MRALMCSFLALTLLAGQYACFTEHAVLRAAESALGHQRPLEAVERFERLAQSRPLFVRRDVLWWRRESAAVQAIPEALTRRDYPHAVALVALVVD